RRGLVLSAAEARATMKLTPKRKKWLGDLLSGQAADLLVDPVGLAEEELVELERLVEELGDSQSDRDRREAEEVEFDVLREMLETFAQQAGVDLNLDGLELNGDPAEFEAELAKRFAKAENGFRQAIEGGAFEPKPKRKRKPS